MVLKRIKGKYALVSRKKPQRVLKYFSIRKPSPEQIKKEEQRIAFWKAIRAGKGKPY